MKTERASILCFFHSRTFRHISRLSNRTPWRLVSPIATFGLSLGLLAGCGSPVVNPVTGQAERSVMDERAEIAAGQEGHKQVLSEYGAVKDAQLQAYVNQVGQRLAAQRAHCAWQTRAQHGCPRCPAST